MADKKLVATTVSSREKGMKRREKQVTASREDKAEKNKKESKYLSAAENREDADMLMKTKQKSLREQATKMK